MLTFEYLFSAAVTAIVPLLGWIWYDLQKRLSTFGAEIKDIRAETEKIKREYITEKNFNDEWADIKEIKKDIACLHESKVSKADLDAMFLSLRENMIQSAMDTREAIKRYHERLDRQDEQNRDNLKIILEHIVSDSRRNENK